MADSAVTVVLNRGLDTETPSFLQEPGSLTDCLNYEFTGEDGIRRIDGYERYDGGPGGDSVDYMYVLVTVDDAAVIPLLTTNAPLHRFSAGKTMVVGTVIAYTPGVLTYIPLQKTTNAVSAGDKLDIVNTGVGRLTTTQKSAAGRAGNTAAGFVSAVRTHSTILRNAVAAQENAVAGVYWLRKSAIAALDTPMLELNSSELASLAVGMFVSNANIIYQVVGKSTASPFRAYIEPTGYTHGVAGVVRVSDGVIVRATNATVTTAASPHAYLVRITNPDIRGYNGQSITMRRSVFVTFTGGSPSGIEPKPGNFVYQFSGATYRKLWIVKSINLTSGSWAGLNAAGTMELVPEMISEGTPNYAHMQVGDTLQNASGGGAVYFTVSAVEYSALAGTAGLRDAQSKYVWHTHNFTGSESTLEAYGANGYTRSFWVQTNDTYVYVPRVVDPGAVAVGNEYSWGSIRAVPDTSLDKPAFVTIHGGTRLALGYRRGSLLLSVTGLPYDFSGLRGAMEVATGDEITGLVNAVEDSTIIFGRRSIRRLVGNTSSTLQLKTVSASTGALPYTAVLVGSTPVFTGVQGISTLEQSEAYGDFAGKRISENVAGELRPKLVTSNSGTELSGVVMAVPVRNKDQYRLWLANGEVITATFSADNVRMSRQRYSAAVDVRVPIAASSETADDSKEHIFVAWDIEHSRGYPTPEGTVAGSLPNPNMIYELDKGWGFDGSTFSNYFELTPIFSGGSVTMTGVDKVRLYGKGYGLATIQARTAGVEDDFDQAFHSTVQDISMPPTLDLFSTGMRPVTSIIDQANWGLGVKLRIENITAEGLTTTEPSHICQVLVLHTRKGAQDA